MKDPRTPRRHVVARSFIRWSGDGRLSRTSRFFALVLVRMLGVLFPIGRVLLGNRLVPDDQQVLGVVLFGSPREIEAAGDDRPPVDQLASRVRPFVEAIPRLPSQAAGHIAHLWHAVQDETSGFWDSVLRRDQSRNPHANRDRQPVPSRDDPLQISVNEGQTKTMRATVVQHIRSATPWVKVASIVAPGGCVRIELGFDSHRRL